MAGLTREQRAERARSVGTTSVDEAQREGMVMGDSRDPNAKVKQQRQRIPLNAGQVLSTRGYELEEDKYNYHWFLESETRSGRIGSALDAYYEHCTFPDGSNVSASSGNGTMYLMRLPLKYHIEDVKGARERREALRRRENQIKAGEYAVDRQGRPVYEGEAVAHRKVSDNPYS